MNLPTFLDPVALAIVGGGTLLAIVLRTPLADLANAMTRLRTLLGIGITRDATALIGQIDAQSRIAQRHGVMALDRSVIADSDVAEAIAAIVDGAGPDDVRLLVRDRRAARTAAQASAADTWAGAAEAAPAMGMVGTLVGLARMFAEMNDTAAIGQAMAIALLATLYGALLGNLVFMPLAARLRAVGRRDARERARLEAPLVSLAEREEPRPGLRTAA